MDTLVLALVFLGAFYRIFNRFSKDKDVYDDDARGRKFPYRKYAAKNWDNWVKVVIGGIVGYFCIPIVYYVWTHVSKGQGDNLFVLIQETGMPYAEGGYAIVSGFLGSLIFDKLLNKTKEV